MATYTTGNWTIEELYVDSISTPKTMSLPDLDWAHDWHQASKPTGRSVASNAAEAYFGDSTGPTVDDVEHLTVSHRPVKNVYDDLPIPIDVSNQYAQKTGRAVYRSFTTIYKATNSVSGQEVYIPLRSSRTYTIPAMPLVTPDLVTSFLKRSISSELATGSTDGTLLLAELRRDLDPTT
jgi:hypothetical protein